MDGLPPTQPTSRRRPREVLRIAHRGVSGVDDYDVVHLRGLADQGAHLVEIDIRTTADGQLIVHHDPEITVRGGTIPIREITLAELSRLAGNRAPPAEEILRDAHTIGLGLYVDIKEITKTATRRLVRLLAKEDLADRCIVASTDAAIVATCAEVAPGYPRAILFRCADQDAVALAREARADFVHPCWEQEDRPDTLLNGRWLAAVRRRGLGIICWHEERPAVLARLLVAGVDGICTDEPALLAELAAAVG